MQRLYSGHFDYPGYRGSHAHCWLDLFGGDPDRPAVVIVTECRDNGGTSISSAIEVIAAMTCWTFGLDPACTLFVGHFHASHALNLGERFTFVEFCKNGCQRPGSLGQPRWSPTTKRQVESLVGHALLESRP